MLAQARPPMINHLTSLIGMALATNDSQLVTTGSQSLPVLLNGYQHFQWLTQAQNCTVGIASYS